MRQDDERIDYDEFERLAHEHKPKMIMVGASAYPRVFDFERIGQGGPRSERRSSPTWRTSPASLRRKCIPSPVPHSDFVTTTTHKTLRGPRGGLVLCRSSIRQGSRPRCSPACRAAADAHRRGEGGLLKEALEPGFADYQRQIVANARRPRRRPRRAGFRLVSGGTDNHLMLVDVFSKGLTGKVAEAALGKAGIVNKNAIPFDKNPPMVASGIRIGTPAVTSRGMGEPEMDLVAEYIARALAGPEDDAALAMVRTKSACAASSRIREAQSSTPRRRPRSRPEAAGAGDPGVRAARGAAQARRRGLARLAGGGVLLAEAGTGTGKTSPYLDSRDPSRHRVLVSTGTKNLQEQIYFKDLRCSARPSACPSPPPI